VNIMKKVITLLLTAALMLSVTACSEDVNPGNRGNDTTAETTATTAETTAQETQSSTLAEVAESLSMISAEQARQIALESVGGGNVVEIEFDVCDGRSVFEVEVKYNGVEYEVVIDALTGEVIRLRGCSQSSVTTTPANPQPPANTTQPPTPTTQPPVPPPTTQRPATQSPQQPNGQSISLERAIEIGYAEIANRGFTGTFRESCRGSSRGQQVWELLYRVQGGRLPLVEMYISMETGEIIMWEWDD
jgi:uncharacterized membrane protein YkoI